MPVNHRQRQQRRIEARRVSRNRDRHADIKAKATRVQVKSDGDLARAQDLAGKVLRERALRAKFDLAQTTPNNSNWWSMTDSLSAARANSPAVRKKMRERSRYETDNGPWLAGILKTLKNDSIGTGPRLQLNPNMPVEDATVVERLWWDYACTIGLADKLKLMRGSRAMDGESFALFITNNGYYRDLFRGPTVSHRTPTIDLVNIEADQFGSALFDQQFTENYIDGITFDPLSQLPLSYEMFEEHPGDLLGFAQIKTVKFRAQDVIHDFEMLRPGQKRGVPELCSSLSLFAQMRDYRQAVIDTAKAAAYYTIVLKSSANPDDDTENLINMDEIDLQRNMATVLPAGTEMSQVDPAQPTTQYPDFMHELVNEMARPIGMPFNIAAGNSQNYNYSSGRLDHQSYHRMIENDRNHFARVVVDRFFDEWAREGILVEGYLPQSFRSIRADWSHEWMWDGFGHVDPEKESKAETNRLNNRTTTLKDIYAREGKDWRRQIDQASVEDKYMAKKGVRRQDIIDQLDMDPGEDKKEEINAN